MNAVAFLPVEKSERHRFTVDDVERMTDIGVLHPGRSTELIDGAIWEMASEGEAHITYKGEIITWFAQHKPASVRIAADSTLHLDAEEAPEPDLYLYQAGASLKPVDVSQLKLVVEVADSSIDRDQGVKAALYAQFGIPEYWVVDIGRRRTLVHLAPEYGAYPEPQIVEFTDLLRPTLLPEMTLCIASLPDLA